MKFNFETKSRFRILSKGRVALCLSALTSSLLIAAPVTNELPTNPNVVSGNININTNSNTMNINQSTDKGIINWGSFNIGSANTVNFNQPNVTSTTLNRVVGNDVSTIAGNLNANGKVVLINPNGVIFEEGSKVDVGAITASTMNQSDENFLKDNVQFTRDSNVGKIINKGTITAKDKGYVALLAPEIINEGIITAKLGTIALASGDKVTLDFKGDGVLKVEVDKSTIDTLIENRQLVQAEGGIVYISSKAASDIQNTTISNKGTISANSMQEVGGKIVLLGSNITNSGNIEAKGKTGGGEILIGGDYQGTNSDTYHQATNVTQTATGKIDASATDKGNGGKVVLWSTKTTDFAGSIKAMGAGIGGNGGKVEVSGKTLLNYTGNVNLLGGIGGKTGDLLLDPYNLYITAGTGGSVTAGSNNSILGVNTLVSALDTANVTLSTGSSGTQTGNIGILANITSTSTNSLTLSAAGNIVVDSNINLGGAFNIQSATGNFVMGANLSSGVGATIIANGGFTKTGTGTSYLTGSITTNNTDINISGPVQVGSFDGTSNPVELNSNGGAITLSGAVSGFSGTNLQAYTSVMAQNMFDGVVASGTGTSNTMSITFGTAGNWSFIPLWGMSEAVNYLVIGGGGGGGTSDPGVFAGGGGGAGGVANGSMTLISGTLYGMIVGAGGAAGTNGWGTNASGSDIGGDTSFNGILSGGGGAGGGHGYGSGSAGRGGIGYAAGGGGGGGGGAYNTGNHGYAGIGGAGIQRNGGKGSETWNNDGGTGGGSNASTTTTVTNAGFQSSITGTSVTYGVGGATTSTTPGTGGNSPSYPTYHSTGYDGAVILGFTTTSNNSTASKLAINSGSGTVTLGSTVSNLSNLNITASGASSVAGIISGAGSVTKAGTGTTTLNGANTYTGGTTVNAGTLKAGVNSAFSTGLITVASGGAVDLNGKTIANNFNISGTGVNNSGAIYESTNTARTISSTITLAGDSTIKSTADGALTLSGTINGAYGLTINTDGTTDGAFTQSSAINGLASYTVISDTALVTLSSAINTTGAISVSGGKIAVNGNLTTTQSGSGISVLAKKSIVLNNALTFTTNNGNLLFASDTDGTGGGNFSSASTFIANTTGGNITIGGGSDGLGYALGNGDSTDGGWYYSGVAFIGAATLNSGGGNINIKGKSSTINGGGHRAWGVGFETTASINSSTGTVSIDGISQGGAGDYCTGVAFNYTNGTTSITSANTTANAIKIIGNAATAVNTTWNSGIRFHTAGASVTATGVGGGITLQGTKNTTGTNGDIYFQGGNILANGGAINISGLSTGGNLYLADTYIGSKASTTVTSSASAVTLSADYFTITGTTPGLNIDTTGAVNFISNSANFTAASTFTKLSIGQTQSPTSFTFGSSTQNGQNLTISAGDIKTVGAINLYAKDLSEGANLQTTGVGSGISLMTKGNITSSSAISITSGSSSVEGGNILFASDTDNSGDGYIYFSNALTVNSYGGNITFGGGDSSGSSYAVSTVTDGYSGVGLLGVFTLNSSGNSTDTGGTITLKGETGGTLGTYAGIRTNGQFLINSGTERVIIDGTSTKGDGIVFSWNATGGTNPNYAITSAYTGGTAISVTGTTTVADRFGILLTTGDNGNMLFQSTGANGGISLIATSTTGRTLRSSNYGGGIYTNLQLLSQGGNIIASGTGSADYDVFFYGQSYFGNRLNNTAVNGVTPLVTNSNANISILSDNTFYDRTTIFSSTGAYTFAPTSNAFTTAPTWNGTLSNGDFLVASGAFMTGYNNTTIFKNFANISGLTIGKSTSTSNSDITISSAISIAGGINLYGGNININNILTTASNTVTLQGSGNIIDGASGYIVADKLAILGGSVTLDHTSNNVNTLAASGVGTLTYIDSNALTIGVVNPTGITATGAVSISTLTGDLTISENITTTNITSSAIVLNAGKSTASGTVTGGNIIISGTPTITAGSGGSGGTIKLYSGSVSGSTGLTSLVGSGSGNFRYNSDETTTNYSTVLATNAVNAIYREAFSISGAISSSTITYGDANPTFTISGGSALQNGDSSNVLTISGSSSSTAGKLKAGTYTVTAGGLSALGYTVGSITNGTLTVNTKALNISGLSANNKIYDGLTTATFIGTGTVSQYTNDIVSLTGTATGLFSSEDVGTNKNVTVSELSLTGADASNYSLNSLTLNANITKANLTLTADNRTKVYGDALTLGTSAFTSSGLQNSETIGSVTLSSVNSYASSTTQDVSTYSNEIGISNVIGGTFDINNYDVSYVASNLSITKKALSISYTGTNKIYDGTNSAIVSETLTGLINSDAVSVSETSVFDNKDVGTSKNISISSITLSGADAGNYSIGATSSTTANITKANLTVKANNDAKFVTQNDSTTYNGVSYNGFVAGETTGVLGGTLAISRTGTGTVTAAGTYNNVLIASGLTSGNYNFNYVTGDYTIVGSNQLLVKVANISNTYGTTAQYAISSAEYYNGSNIIRLDNASVSNSSVSVNSSNLVSITDGSSGTATFTLSPNDALTSTAGKLKVGSYQLGINGTVTENSDNFSNTITVIGSHEVNQKSLTASATGISKVYDGTTSMSGVTLGLNTLETSDVVTVNGTGAFSDKNVGNANKSYTISNLALSGNDSANYYLSGGGSFSGNNGTITAKQVTLSASKVYDGNTNFDSSEVIISGLIGNETLTYSGATINDKNVATSDKYINSITLANATDSSGGIASNYILPTLDASNAGATITAKQLTLSALKVYDGNTDLDSSEVTISGLIGSETLTYSGATINDKNVITANKYINAITLANATDSSGGISSNYILPTLNASNASATVTVKDVTVLASGGISKVYDATTAMNGISIGLSGQILNDNLTVSGIGAFSSKNVGTGLSYTLNNLTLSGTDASNYRLSGGATSVTGNDGVITQKTLVVNYTGVDKTYDGNNIAIVTTTDNKISGDSITINKDAIFSDKNVGTSKIVSISNASLSGADAGNYSLSTTGTTTANINRLNSVTWIGGNSGNWFDPANWAGGTVPDLSNVANVIIPANVTVNFDTTGVVSPADISAVNLDSLSGSTGSLIQTNGTLNIGNGGTTLNGYTQNGGTFTNSGTTTLTSYNQSSGNFSGTGNFSATNFTQSGGIMTLINNFTVTEDFNQGTSGSVTVGGNSSITDISGGATIGNLDTTGTTTIASTNGAITQASGTTIKSTGATTLNATSGSGTDYDITLNGTTNDFSTINVTGKDVTLKDINSLITLITATGNTTLNTGGDLTVSGTTNNLSTTTTNGGKTIFGNTTVNGLLNTLSDANISQTTGTSLNVAGITTLNAGTNDITLNDTNNDFKNTVSTNGKNISLTDINTIELGNTTATQKLNVNAIQDIIQKYNTVITSGADTTLIASNGDINLSGNNNFQGSVNSSAKNITLKDSVNGINLADTKAKGNLTVHSTNGDITQKENSVIEVNEISNFNATNENNKYNIILDGSSNNQFKDTLNADGNDVILKMRDKLIRGNIKVTGKEEIIINGQKVSYQEIITPKLSLMLPEVSVPSEVSIEGISLPQGNLNLSTNTTVANNSSVSSGNANNSSAGTSVNVSSNTQVEESSKTSFDGMIVGKTQSGNDVKAMVIQGSMNSSTPTTLIINIKSSEGFEFEIPQNVVSKAYENENLELKVKNVMKSNGEDLPSWVAFDSKTMSFSAKNVPEGSLPLKVNVTLSNGKVDKNIEVIIK